MFKKIDEYSDKLGLVRKEEMDAKKLYVRKLEGQKLASFVERYTTVKSNDAENANLLEIKHKIRAEKSVLRNMHPKELSPRSLTLKKLSG